MPRHFRPTPTEAMIELVEAKINRECVLAGKPPPYDLSNPTDADIADHAADFVARPGFELAYPQPAPRPLDRYYLGGSVYTADRRYPSWLRQRSPYNSSDRPSTG